MGVFRVFIGSANQAMYDFTAFFENENIAMEVAWGFAIQDYETYEGLHGIRDLNQIMEEEGIEDEDEDVACEVYLDERNAVIDYYVEECFKEDCKDCKYRGECTYEW